MILRSKIRNALIALSGAMLLGPLVSMSPAEAGSRHGWRGYRPVVVHRHVVHRPVVRRVVYVHRPVIYRPRPVVRRVVVVERPYYPRVRYGHRWRHRVGFGPGWHHRRWRDRPRCWLPERYLCR